MIQSDIDNLNNFEKMMNETLNTWEGEVFIIDALLKNFKTYTEHIKGYKEYVAVQVLSKHRVYMNAYERIIDTVAHYLRNDINKANEILDETVKGMNDIILSRNERKVEFGPIVSGFRAREIAVEKGQPERHEMFHVPFEDRHKVADYRYSMHGIPSVYLGKSIYGCYLELGKPSLDKFWVSQFSFVSKGTSDNEINVFNFTKPNLPLIRLKLSTRGKLEGKNKNIEGRKEILDSLVEDIVLWPIISACSFVCRYPDFPFRQEYILPQMLYRLISKYNKFVGMSYTSTKQTEKNIPVVAMKNYAIPAQDVRKAGYCPKLSSQLFFTEPILPDMCKATVIDNKIMYTGSGIPILSNIEKSLRKNEIIVSFDKMAMYFENKMKLFMKTKDTSLFGPIHRWKED